jgi:hypothetical protein
MRVLILIAVAAIACGNDGGGYSDGGNGCGGCNSGGGGANTLSGVVDFGPAALQSQHIDSANTLFVTVTVCAPGTSTCQNVDHVQVDTGSTGLRILSEALTVQLPPSTTSGGAKLFDCEQFVDSAVWGAVATADVTLGQAKISSTPVQIIGGTTVPVPASCTTGTPDDTIATFGANGLLGIGNFLQDCGAACAQTIVSGAYYACNGNTCSSASVPIANQLQNLVGALSSDNNGVTLQLGAVGEPGAPQVNGTVIFGVGTQTDNALGSAQWVALDNQGTFVTSFNGSSLSKSFIDSGSNALYFPDSAIPNCPGSNSSFFCPASSQQLSASIQGRTVNFQIDNAVQLFNTRDAAYPGLGGTNGSGNFATGFDWGLPFFYGRTVYVLFEGRSAGSQTGPAVAY